ncbi:hypothetical protein U8527_04720 [Kordia algicida OT-1]|uniref:Uncharacterized protein n=1 Tax=Kordia algicida OT-1 TaxID=391587 RepID=A9DM46_9FLAO|nr:hypothetical protein [Kordia algicida]EDP97627.1 hypothetical protein KAOT1_20732 [Kordia algicida OT-1]
MKAVKIGLLIFTVLITILLFLLSYLLFSRSRSFESAESALFFLGCTSAFSIYFHVKTLRYYPLFIFGKTIEELSKKYWALHVAFGLINFLLGIGILLPTIYASNLEVNIYSVVVAICFIIFGLVTLWELYKLNRFVQVYKQRRQQQREIEDIKGATR